MKDAAEPVVLQVFQKSTTGEAVVVEETEEDVLRFWTI